MVAGCHGLGVDLAELRRRFPPGAAGISLNRLAAVAHALGFATRAVTLSVAELDRLRLPCVLHWRFDHFVVLQHVRRNSVSVVDPAGGARRVPRETLSAAFTGVALELVPGVDLARRKPAPPLRLRHLLPARSGLKTGIAAALALALLGEAALLTTPYYLQLVIDAVLPNGDAGLLQVVAVAFAGLAVFQTASETLRRLAVQRLGSIVSFDVAARIHHRLLELPIGYFQARELGDLQHRLRSIAELQRFVVATGPQLLLDAGFALPAALLLLAYEPRAAALVFAVTALYVLWRLAWLGPFRRAAEDIVRSEATLQTGLLGTLRAMTTVKLTVAEAGRETEWLNGMAAQLNATLRAGNLAIADQSLATLAYALLRVAVVYLLATLALAGDLTVGMLSAFVAYYGMFNQRILRLVAGIVEYRLLAVPLERLADIVFASPERRRGDAALTARLAGAVTLERVSFRYSGDTAAVLKRCRLALARGEFVAILGASGSGKSTLLKLIAGLLQADDGLLRYDGIAAERWDVRALRRRIGTVLQEDTLLPGTLAENIAGTDGNRRPERLRAAATAAAIAADIDALPLGFDTRAGDLANALSAGQTQRLLLARALYRRPALLLLDEVTGGLDRVTEEQVLRSLQSLSATRLFATHRATVAHAADRVLELRDGRLHERRPPAPA